MNFCSSRPLVVLQSCHNFLFWTLRDVAVIHFWHTFTSRYIREVPTVCFHPFWMIQTGCLAFFFFSGVNQGVDTPGVFWSEAARQPVRTLLTRSGLKLISFFLGPLCYSAERSFFFFFFFAEGINLLYSKSLYVSGAAESLKSEKLKG